VENAVRQHAGGGTQIEVQAGLDSVQGWLGCRSAMTGRRDAAPVHVPPVTVWHLGHEIVSRVMQAHGGRFIVAEAPQASPPAIAWKYPLAG
jgi:two-component system sensor histidine kinase QseC